MRTKCEFDVERRAEYLAKGVRRIFIYDIETTDLDPRIGVMLGYSAKIVNVGSGEVETITNFLTGNQIVKNNNEVAKTGKIPDPDREILKDLSEKMRSCQLVVGHFAKFFDNRFFKDRCYLLGLNELVPHYKELRYADTWVWQKTGIRTRFSGSLDTLVQVLNIKNLKTKFDAVEWSKARQGSQPQIDKIEDHCVKDVYMTAQIFQKLEHQFPISGGYV